MNFIETVKTCFRGPTLDPVAAISRETFHAATDAYDTAFHAIEA
jgi:hypothetical protein